MFLTKERGVQGSQMLLPLAITQNLLLTGVLNIITSRFIMNIPVQPITSMLLYVFYVRHLPKSNIVFAIFILHYFSGMDEGIGQDI